MSADHAQLPAAEREHIPFPLLSDPGRRLAAAIGLPTSEVEGMRLYRRLTLVAEGGGIVKAFYPVFPPDRDAGEVLAWLAARRPRGGGGRSDGGAEIRTRIRGRGARVSTGLAGAWFSSPGVRAGGHYGRQSPLRFPLADGAIRPGEPAF